MDRLTNIFSTCKQENRAALIIFATAGYPDLPKSEAAMELAIENGADILEIGMPFSDPVADGPVICQASRIALRNSLKLEQVLNLIQRLRARHPKLGLILFSYMNVMFNYNLNNLCKKLRTIGADGILPVDLPLEERQELLVPCQENNLHLIPLVTPVTPKKRLKDIVSNLGGFIYSVNVEGVTGCRSNLPETFHTQIDQLKTLTNLPVAAGFGISNNTTAQNAAKYADAIIIGSAFVSLMNTPQKIPQFIQLIKSNLQK